jgi:uncharacterized protein (TIGR00106 family)
MTAIARLEVIPVREGSMSDEIASAIDALEAHDVAYETTATDTVIEADDVAEIFAAVQAAHAAVDGDRVITSLEVDDQRDREQHIDDRVSAIETALGHPPRREADTEPAE